MYAFQESTQTIRYHVKRQSMQLRCDCGDKEGEMPEFTEELVMRLYKTMYTIRSFEEKVSEYARTGMVPGFMIHLSVGQEAVPTGVCAALREDDYIVSTHRGHGHLIAKGASTDRMMAELKGKETGYCRGRGGSMHITSVEVGGLGANGIVGAGLVIAPGAALSARMRGTDQVTVCFFGDGASNQGTFHEGLNLAATWKLPVVFVCENNRYGFSTPQKVHQSIGRISRRAEAYDMPGITVNGDDVLEVFLAASWAIEHARGGGGPTLLEATTYRWHGHFEDDDDDYRSAEEKAEFPAHDPITLLERRCIEQGMTSSSQLERIRSEVGEEIARACAFAEESEEPSPEDDAGLIFAGGEQ
jgi:acetoin:2,6-dichlorophenolindophenol oxidoreductase subunit alpha